jgi:hypothetical protein
MYVARGLLGRLTRPQRVLEPTRTNMRTRRVRWVLPAATVLGLALPAAPAAAWNFAEHNELGRAGYEAACAQLVTDKVIDENASCETPKDAVTARWCLACKVFSAALYGQSVAIAGDKVGSPEALMTVSGEKAATNLIDYGLLALVNVQHFHPDAPRNWRKFHERALVFATGETDWPGYAEDFAHAFYYSAFADHFLQDSFAAGHAGFNRASSSAAASKAFHDIWNASGRLFKAPTGKCWIQFGDNQLSVGLPESREQIDAAESASVYDVIAAFVTRKRDGAREIKPTIYMPVATTRDALPAAVGTTEGRDDGAADKPLKSTPYISQITMGQRRKLGVCAQETVPIDGMSNPAELSSGRDYWVNTRIDDAGWYGGIDVVWNYLFEAFPSAIEGGLSPAGVDYRGGVTTFAPGILAGVFLGPLYLVHGLWRNEIGVQGTAFARLGNVADWGTYVTGGLRSSLEVATTIYRLQVGPSFDPRTEKVGVAAAFGVELDLTKSRSVRGGGTIGY